VPDDDSEEWDDLMDDEAMPAEKRPLPPFIPRVGGGNMYDRVKRRRR
jgi:hypothetical protein